MATTNRRTVTDAKGSRLFYTDETGKTFDYTTKKFVDKPPPLARGQRELITNPKGGKISYTDETGKTQNYTGPSYKPKPGPAKPATPLPSNPGATALWNDVLEANPWLRTLGVTAAQMKEIAATSSGSSELLSKLRDLDVVRRRTQGMYRSDGTRRFASEAELFRWEDQVRGVLRQAGVDVDREYANPETLIGFAEANLAPDEVRDRLAAWKGVKETGQRAREIFYVYGGLNFTDDDLYEALVDPAKGQALQDAANKAVGEKLSTPGAWAAWIDRARQAGQARIVSIFEKARQTGATFAATIQRVLSVDTAFGNDLMDALYHGGDPGSGDFLDLTSLLDAYEFMAVGAAAEGAGLELPTKERLQEIRAAGIERSRQIDAYTQFGLDRNKLNAAVQRARGETFTTTDFENATFFGDINARRELEQGEAALAGAGRQQGQFSFARGNRGQFVQSGLSAR